MVVADNDPNGYRVSTLSLTPIVDAQQALSMAKEPQANVERYDALRQTREVRHAS